MGAFWGLKQHLAMLYIYKQSFKKNVFLYKYYKVPQTIINFYNEKLGPLEDGDSVRFSNTDGSIDCYEHNKLYGVWSH